MPGSLRETDAGEAIAARIRAVLASRDLTLHQVSVMSRRIYGADSSSLIPHTLYHSLRNSTDFCPSLAQTCALSRITGYRIYDWMMALGIDVGRIRGLQVTLPATRTRLIDPTLSGINIGTGPHEISQGSSQTEGVLPFAQMLEMLNQGSRQHRQLTSMEPRPLFAKIGRQDSYAFPELLPGSIVSLTHAGAIADLAGQQHPPLLLIEHERGLWCGRFRVSEEGIIVAASAKLAYAPIGFRFPQEARILGAVDMEIRWIHRFESPMVPQESAIWRQPSELAPTTMSFGRLLRQARATAGLTLREASLLSLRISRHLNNVQYAIAQSTLSDCEASDAPPRHLEKVITLFLIYGLKLSDLVAASGNNFDQLGQQPIPASLIRPLPEAVPGTANRRPRDVSLFENSVLLPGELGIVSWFLDGYLAEVSGILRPSLRDLFWLTGDQPFLPAGTTGATLAVVDRRKKRPARIPGRSTWQQPAWLLLLRDGQYRCACCSLDGKTLVLYPESDRSRAPEQLRIKRDVEVIGQIVGLARHVN